MLLDTACDGTFMIAVLPDTQQYAAENADGFHAMTQWVVDHREAQRIAFCSHVGDVVRHFDRPQEWRVGHEAMARLDGVVPYGISVGNNDMEESTGEAASFCSTFAPRRYQGRSWFGGFCRDGADSWQTFEAMGERFLILHIECNAPDAVLDWANGVIGAHSGYRTIITTHMFLGPIARPQRKEDFFTAPRGVARWSKCHGADGNSPRDLWDKCFSRHRDVFLILCGDQSRVQAMRMALVGRHGNRVHACLCDYYGAAEGWLRLHRISVAKRRMEVITYGATSGTMCQGTQLVPDEGEHRFVVELDW